ncbi:MAG: redoxin domain-containing protein [Muribaculaceae bacterium]|nr:redoxin domain-containing protein [Muribaculaceae bacterium]
MKFFFGIITAISLLSGGWVSANARKIIYDFNIPTQKGDSVSMDQFKGKVILIVNTASKCGFTPQYSDLEKLYETYNDQGFEIIDLQTWWFQDSERMNQSNCLSRLMMDIRIF